MKTSTANTLIAIILVSIGVSLRILPHPDNFAPIAAIAIFGGAVLPRKYAVLIPLGAMILSDAVIGFHNLILVTWGSYALIALASSTWLHRRNIFKTGLFTASSSLFYFVVTNFAVWVWSGMYSHSIVGLTECYTLALPFFRNTFLSDIVYTASLFGIYALARRVVNALAEKKSFNLTIG